MKNKFKVAKNFIFETAVTFLPFTIAYLILGNWLSDVTDFGRTYVVPSDVTDLWEVYGSVVKYGWIEFEGFKKYSFEVSLVFWGGLISAIVLIVIGRLIYLWLMRTTTNRAKFSLMRGKVKQTI